VEFSQLHFYGQDIVDLSILAIIKHVSIRDNTRHLIAIIARCKPRQITAIFSKFIRLWAECYLSEATDEFTGDARLRFGNRVVLTGEGQVPAAIEDSTFYGHEKARLTERVSISEIAMHNVLQFATKVADSGLHVRQAMVEAGVLALVLITHASRTFQMQNLLSSAKQPRSRRGCEADAIPSDVINAEAANLASLVTTPGFRSSWSGQVYRAKRAACLQFLRVLFGNAGETGKSSELGEKYEWMRALYQKILAL